MNTDNKNDIREVAIIGSGPSGYTAAIYTARANLRPIVFAGSVTAGGALMNTTEVENFPGFIDGIMGPDLMDNLKQQAERFGTEIIFDDAVDVELTGPVKTIITGNGETYRFRTVIISTGSAYRELGLDSERELSGRGVSYCATCDGFFYKDQDIAVVGGGDSAMEEALFLSRFARSVTVVHRRDALRASSIMAERAQAHPTIRFEWNAAVSKVLGTDRVTGLQLTDTKTGENRELPVTGVFVAIGHEPRSTLFREQLELDKAGYIKVFYGTTETSVPGVFAAGDVVDHRYRQAITAAGSGCSAALDAQWYLEAIEDTEAIAASAQSH